MVSYLILYYFYNQLLQSGSNVLPQWGSPDRFASALPVVVLPLLQPPPQGIGHHPGVGVKIEHWPRLAMSKDNWMAFTSANWFDSPSTSAVLATCHVGLHTAAFHLRCFPTMRQDPSVNRAYCFSSSGSLLYSGASSAHAPPPLVILQNLCLLASL